MHTIAQSQMLLRNRVALPDGLTLATDEFHEDWSFVRPADALRLGKHLEMRGWSFANVVNGSLRSGVGDTSQKAIASALKLALRHISAHSNAAEVEHIELTQYPWFFLARVKVLPYCIQPAGELSLPEQTSAIPVTRRQRRMPIDPGVLYPHFNSAMPQLKQMLISPERAVAGPQ
jgi:hypothetical protein